MFENRVDLEMSVDNEPYSNGKGEVPVWSLRTTPSPSGEPCRNRKIKEECHAELDSASNKIKDL